MAQYKVDEKGNIVNDALPGPTQVQTPAQPMFSVNPMSSILGAQGANPSVLDKNLIRPLEKPTININPDISGTTDLTVPPSVKVDTSEFSASSKASIAAAEERYNQAKSELDKFKQGVGGETEDKSFWEGMAAKREKASEGMPTQAMYEETLKKWGFTPESLIQQKALEKELSDYQTQISDLELQKQTLLGERETAMQGRATSSWIGESALIERKFNSRIAAVAAKGTITQMKYDFAQNNMENAQKLADQYVKFKTYEYEQDLADIQWIKDTYKEMSAEEEKLYDRAYQEKKDKLTQAQWEAQHELDVYKAENTKTTNDDIRVAIDNELKLKNAFGQDNKVAWESYLWMLQNWVNNGGIQSEFYITYPITQYLDANNQTEFYSKINQ